MKDSVIILSGGMDSVTMLYDYQKSIALAVSFDYGSKHNEREIPFARYHCEQLGIKHVVIALDFMCRYFESSLLKGGGDIPEGDYDSDNMRSTVVPFRNGIMLSIAAGLAESCTPAFVKAMDAAIAAGTYEGIRLVTPYTNLTKAEIAAKGKQLGIDYSQTWSCYKGGEHHCGQCGTCRERKEALAEAGVDDTTIYES